MSRNILAMHVDWSAVPQVPEPRSAQGRATRRRIMLAAADLFAERGIDAVQVHEILERAGQRNASAIQYHFGSLEGLIVAVLTPRPDVREPIEREREAMLDALLLRDRPAGLDEAALALVRPSLHSLTTHDGRAFVQVAAQVTRLLPIGDRVAPGLPTARRAMALAAARMPEMPERIAHERLATVFTVFIESLANRAREIETGVAPNLDDEAFEAELVTMIVAVLTAPSAAPART